MQQRHGKTAERGKRRKTGYSASPDLGHVVNSHMTVIWNRWSAIRTNKISSKNLERRILARLSSFYLLSKKKIAGGEDMSIFTGAGVAIVTPMKANGEVNYPKLEELLNYQIENGTDAIIICGTTGESSTLTHEEHLEAIRFTIEKVAGRIPVIAGTGSNCTETAIYLSQEAEKYGADGLLLVSPYYNKATQKGLIAHFTAIANSVKIPIILYNIQGRTGVNMAPETIAYLAKHVENIVAVKEASGNISQIAKVAQLCGDSCDIYSGNDDQIVPILSLGGKGVISVLSNVAPRETHDIVAKFMAGDVAGSRELQLKALPVIEKLFCEVNPIPVKAALNMLGWEVGPLRMPLTEMEPEHQAQLKEAMAAFGVKAKGEN